MPCAISKWEPKNLYIDQKLRITDERQDEQCQEKEHCTQESTAELTLK